MNLDINKIICESLSESVSVQESFIGGVESANRSVEAFRDIFKGGNSEDELRASVKYAKEAAEKAKDEHPDIIRKISNSSENVQEKIVNKLKEHPGMAAATAAAIAAGIGAIALRKHMKKVKKD